MTGNRNSARRFGRWLGVLGPDVSLERERGELWRLDYLFSIGAVSWIVHLCVTVLAGFVLLQAEAGAWVPGWMAAMVVISLAMASLPAAYRHRWPWRSPEAYGVAHSGITAAAGLAWGAGALLCALSSTAGMLTFFTLVLGGTALGAVSSQHVVMRSCMLSLWTSVPLLAAAWLVEGSDPAALATAAMMMLFGVMLTVLAVRMNDFVVQNVALANELSARNASLLRTGAELAEAQEEKSRFLAQASHDLRQPIHAIGLFVEYLHDTRLGRDGHEVLANIDRSLDSLARLCRSLLDLSALDVGRVRPAIAPVALTDVLGEVVRQATEAARARGVTIRLQPTRLWVRSDAALLHTMAQNLVSNAIKYAPGSRVLVGVRRRAGTVSIVVADTGPGIPPADQQRVFKEFVQIAEADAGEADGLGLGLSIVRRLADMMGLSVGLASQPGKGCRFTIDGLARCAPDASPIRKPSPPHAARLGGLRVLVVDDDRAVRNSTAQLLSRWGCEVRATGRIEEARRPGATDFVLCDHELGGDETGLDLIRRVRAGASTPVGAAIVTGGRTDHLQEACKAEGITILAKPVRPPQLRSVLLAGLAAQASPSSAATPAAAERLPTSSARSSAET